MTVNRLNALCAERDKVRASIVALEDSTVDSVTGNARELDENEDKARGDLETRDGELTSEIERLMERERRNSNVTSIVNEFAQAQGRAQHIENVIPNMTPGEYALTYLRATLRHEPDAIATLSAVHETLARANMARGDLVRAQDLTSDLAGVLPQPIVGDLIKFVDSNRYAINACRELPMPQSGKTFTRPRASQLTTAAQQTEGSALSSQKMTIVSDSVTKTTQGGFVTLTEQDIDWTDPSFFAILIEDLAQSYAIQTDTVMTAAIVAGISTNKVTGVTPGSSAFTIFYPKLVSAAQTVYTAAKRLPDTLFTAVDTWAWIVGFLDGNNRPQFGLNPFNAAGSRMTVDSFQGGNPLGLNVVVDPTFAAGTCIVAASQLCEYFEQNKGLAQIQAPSTLTVDVAYRGYFATHVRAEGLCSMQTA